MEIFNFLKSIGKNDGSEKSGVLKGWKLYPPLETVEFGTDKKIVLPAFYSGEVDGINCEIYSTDIIFYDKNKNRIPFDKLPALSTKSLEKIELAKVMLNSSNDN
ncbi:MAG TPA: hypothetical protein VLE44_02450 [Candidatus Saccharimonadales bacterium]|nr:hypothetical protein [Candidatus Saccharimonadales bacterium]